MAQAGEKLNHNDRSGFLIGERITDDIERMAAELQLLRGVESNTREAVSLLRRMANAPAPADAGRQRAVAQPSRSAANDSSGERSRQAQRPARASAPADAGSTRSSPAESRTASSRSSAGPDTSNRHTRRASAPADVGAPASRDGRGRFSSGPLGSSVAEPGGSSGAIKSMVDAVKGIASSTASGTDSIDPTIQAAKELGGMLAPATALFKPLGGLFGRGKEAKEAKQHRESVNWMRRIWRTQIDGNKKAGGGGMMMRMLGMLAPLLALLMGPLKMLGAMKMAGGLAGLARGALGGIGGRRSRNRRGADDGPSVHKAKGKAATATTPGWKSGGKLAGKAAGVMGMGKGLLKRIPILGALIGGGMLANGLMTEAKTPEEKKEKWGSVGGAAGGLIGGALGMIGGPAGAIAGGMLGDYIGEKVGTWLATADLGAMISDVEGVFGKMADATKELATGAFKHLQDAWSGLIEGGSELFSSMKDWVGEKLGVAKDTVQDVAYTAKDKVSSGVSTVKDAGQNFLNKVTGGRYEGGSNSAKGAMVSAMAEAGITDPKSQAALMANVDHESGGFTRSEENLNYSAKRLQQVFPKYYKDAESARADAGNPEAIANRVYGGRMGNTEAGDGFKYRGRGMIQLTGKAQYESMGKKLGVDLVNNPELAADPKIAAKIAANYWKTSGADKAATSGDMVKARKLVNGGTNGLADVQAKTAGYLEQAKAGELTAAQTGDKVKAAPPMVAQKAMGSAIAKIQPAQSAQPVGVLAPTAAAPKVPPLLAAPAAPPTIKAASYSAPAPDASLTKVPATPEVRTPPGAGAPAKPAQAAPMAPLSQNVSDRQIAHASAGGIGMGMARL